MKKIISHIFIFVIALAFLFVLFDGHNANAYSVNEEDYTVTEVTSGGDLTKSFDSSVKYLKLKNDIYLETAAQLHWRGTNIILDLNGYNLNTSNSIVLGDGSFKLVDNTGKGSIIAKDKAFWLASSCDFTMYGGIIKAPSFLSSTYSLDSVKLLGGQIVNCFFSNYADINAYHDSEAELIADFDKCFDTSKAGFMVGTKTIALGSGSAWTSLGLSSRVIEGKYTLSKESRQALSGIKVLAGPSFNSLSLENKGIIYDDNKATIKLECNAESDDKLITYEWYRDGVKLTNSSSKLDDEVAYNGFKQYRYKVIATVSNGSGLSVSEEKVLDVYLLPKLTSQPSIIGGTNYELMPGDIINLQYYNDQSVRLEYQWYNGAIESDVTHPITGATKASYKVDTKSFSAPSTYYYRLGVKPFAYLEDGTKFYGDEVFSDVIKLNMHNVDKPIIELANGTTSEMQTFINNPLNIEIMVSNINDANIQNGYDELTYNWYKKVNNTWVPFGTDVNKELTFIESDEGDYELRAEVIGEYQGHKSSSFSEIILVHVLDTPVPVIYSEPQNVNGLRTATNKLSVGARSIDELAVSYQWQSSIDSENWLDVEGGTDKDLVLPQEVIVNRYYRVKVTSYDGTKSIYSEVVVVNIYAEPQFSGEIDGLSCHQVDGENNVLLDNAQTVIIKNHVVTAHVGDMLELGFFIKNYQDLETDGQGREIIIAIRADGFDKKLESNCDSAEIHDGYNNYYRTVTLDSAGTFDFYGYLCVKSVIDFWAENREYSEIFTLSTLGMEKEHYIVNVLPNEDLEEQEILQTENQSISIDVDFGNQALYAIGDWRSEDGQLRFGEANQYKMVVGYELYIELEEDEGYQLVVKTDYDLDHPELWHEGEVNFDASNIDEGIHKAYVVINYRPVVKYVESGDMAGIYTKTLSRYVTNTFNILITPLCHCKTDPRYDHTSSVYDEYDTEVERQIALRNFLATPEANVSFTHLHTPDNDYGDSITYEYKCNDCGEWVFGGILNLFSKNMVTSIDVVEGYAETCDMDGLLKHKECPFCDKVYKYDPIETPYDNCDYYEVESVIIPKHHNLGLVEAVEPDCYTVGNIEYYECSVCLKKYLLIDAKYVEVEEVSLPKVHNLEVHEAVEATCTQNGNVLYYECLECTRLFIYVDGEYQEVIEAQTITTKAHTLELIERVEPSCANETNGYLAHYKCSACEQLFMDEEGLEATTLDNITIPWSHTYSLVDAQDASCDVDGWISHYECSDCHKYFVLVGEDYILKQAEDIIIPKQHGNMIKHNAVEATCSVDGNIEYYECDICHQLFVLEEEQYVESSLEEIIIPANHNLEHILAKEGSCSEPGNVEYYHCTKCDKYFVIENELPVETTLEGVTVIVPHTPVTDSAIAATCTEAGKTEGSHCSVCNAIIVAQEDIAPLGHDLGEWQQDSTKHYKVCSRCDYRLEEEHNFLNDVCSICGYKKANKGENATQNISVEDAKTGIDIKDTISAAVANEAGVELSIDNNQIIFDKGAANQLSANENISLTFVVSQDNLSVIEGKEVKLELEISLGNLVFANGKATIKVAFNEVVPEGKVLKVYFVNGNELVDMNAKLENGVITFETNHFSKYVVCFENEEGNPSGGNENPGENPGGNEVVEPKAPSKIWILFVVLGVVLLAGAGVLVFFIIKRKKKA